MVIQHEGAKGAKFWDGVFSCGSCFSWEEKNRFFVYHRGPRERGEIRRSEMGFWRWEMGGSLLRVLRVLLRVENGCFLSRRHGEHGVFLVGNSLPARRSLMA